MKKIILILAIGLFLSNCESDDESFQLGDGSGVAAISGSLASFAIVDQYLYVLSENELRVLDISNSPALISKVRVDQTAETIFRYGQNLLLGTQSGLLIYDITTRNSPKFLAQVFHQTGCDPVIAKDEIAYVTVRAGISCNSEVPTNALIIVDISDLENPREIKQIEMLSPRGLTIAQDKLFVGEGDFGLKQFSLLNDPTDPVFERIYPNISANDIISIDTDKLIVLGSSGVDQFQIKDDSLTLLSEL